MLLTLRAKLNTVVIMKEIRNTNFSHINFLQHIMRKIFVKFCKFAINNFGYGKPVKKQSIV